MHESSPLVDRRGFFDWSLRGLGATALFHLLGREGAAVSGGLHLPARARRAVQITLVGGLSHLDSFDYKPELTRHHGRTLRMDAPPDIFFGQVGLLRKNDWEFRRRGKSGLWISELFPHIAECADDLTVINSMVADTANHTPGLFMLNSGFQFNGFPAMGSWLSYGLGSDADDLPAYVVLPDGRGEANGGSSNWTNGFLPAQHQGVVFRGGPEPVRDLTPALPVSAAEEAATRAFLQNTNELHLERSGAESALAARIRSYELAARMQLAVPRVADLSAEPANLRAMYGLDRPETADAARRCLLARRLLERGVRFVQIYSGGPIAGSPRVSWDAPRGRPRQPWRRSGAHRSACRGPGSRPQAARHARGHAGLVHDRVRPHPVRAIGGQRRRPGPRSQSLRLLVLAGRRRRQTGNGPWLNG